MPQIQETACCGVKEIDGIMGQRSRIIVRDAIRGLLEFYDDGMNLNCAFLTFSEVIKGKKKEYKRQYGAELAEYIKENKLGTVKKSISKVNPNSGNTIRMYIWETKPENMMNWFKENFPRDFKGYKTMEEEDRQYREEIRN